MSDDEYSEIQQNFYVLKILNDDLPITFSGRNTPTSDVRLVSVSLPLFDNVNATLDTSDVVINGNTYALNDGLYVDGNDLAAELNRVSSTPENITWEFLSARNRFRVSENSGANVAITNTRLTELILGFEFTTQANSYTSTRVMNLFPYSGFVLNSPQLKNTFIYQDELNNTQMCAFMISINTFDFVSKSTLMLDKNSLFAQNVLQSRGVIIFPITIKLSVLYGDGSTRKIPLSRTTPAELVLKY